MPLKQLSHGKRIHNIILPLLVLVFVTLAAYLNAWPDSLTLDDKGFVANRYSEGLSLYDTFRFFSEDLWKAAGADSGLYRPLLQVSIAMDAFVYGDWAAGYHLSNILLHLLVTVLVFGFIRHLLLVSGGKSPVSDHMALLAAMVFGVHPIHTEVVNSIFNRSGLLVSVGVIGGLWWFLRTLESSPRRAWGGLALAYLLVLFCKESGVILPLLAVVMLWIYTPGDWRVKLRKSIPVLWLLIPLGIFLGLRANALDVPSVPHTTGKPEMINIPSTRGFSIHFDWDHLLAASRIWFDSLKLLVWPHPLQIYHSGFSVNKWTALVLQLALLSLAFVGFKQKRYALMAGLAFFYIAILPASWVMKGHPSLAERYIYLPSVGLTIVLAFGLQWLAQRFNLRIATVPVLIALVVLTPVTLARNAEWATDVLLYESSYRRGNQDGRILQMLVGAHLGKKNYSRAVNICDRHAGQMKRKRIFSHRCGKAYSQVGRFDDAEKAFLLAIKDPATRAIIHQELASMYLHLGRKSDAKNHFELAAGTEQNPAFREFRKAYMLLKLYPNDRANLLQAKTHLEQSIQLQPETNQAHQLLNQINRILDEN